MTTKPVEDFILGSERDLRIAAAVVEAWPNVRQRVLIHFFNRLENSLKRKLTGWEFELWGRFFADAYPGFYVRKPVWKAEYSINLECWNHGEKMIFGVWRDEELLKGRGFSGAILSAVQAHFPSARARKWWEAEITLHSPPGDWRQPDVLWRIYKDETFLNDIAGQLREVALIAEPLIDRLVRGR